MQLRVCAVKNWGLIKSFLSISMNINKEEGRGNEEGRGETYSSKKSFKSPGVELDIECGCGPYVFLC